MGINVHKKHIICVRVCEEEIAKRDTLPASPVETQPPKKKTKKNKLTKERKKCFSGYLTPIIYFRRRSINWYESLGTTQNAITNQGCYLLDIRFTHP